VLGHPPEVVWIRRGNYSTAEIVGQPAGLTTIADQGMFIATTARVLDLALVTAGERLMGTKGLRALSNR